MKQKYTKWIYFLAVAIGLQLVACTESNELLEPLGDASQSTNADSRTTEPVTATVVLSETDRLKDQLDAALGDFKSTVQHLTISGTFYAVDVEYLHTLTALEKLDMTHADIKYNNEHSYYSFTYSYVNEYGNTEEIRVNDYQNNNEIGYRMFAGIASLKEFNIPETVTAIRFAAFKNCMALTSITIPGNIKSIDNGAFSESGLTTVNVAEGVTSISGFNDCNLLKTVNLPSTLKKIGDHAFSGCSSIESLTIPEGVEEIGMWALANLPLSSIHLPSTLKRIGSYAFQGSALTEIDIPASVTTLGYGVFESCNRLKTLTVPETVTQVDGSLTNYCQSLSAVFWNSPAEVEDIQGNENCYLYLKNGTSAWGPNWVNVIIGGMAENIELKYDVNTWGGYSTNTFGCPQAFTAKKISITIPFNGQMTRPGYASGWRTLTLPFTPTSISSTEKGQLAPFGSNVADTKPFWLRSLTTKGFVDATTIEPNKPYIIAMPYNTEVYTDEYNISGDVVFKAENVEIAVTPDPLPASEGPDYYLQPTYNYIESGSDVYVLNREWWVEGFDYNGSVFSNQGDYRVFCFEAYVKPKPGTPTRSAYAIDTRSAHTRSASQKNTTGIPAIGDM